MARRVASLNPHCILETAAGTGVVTRAMAARLPASVDITATDLNQAMLDRAADIELTRPVKWRQADATKLPFADETFDTVVCQFGAMFFPDKPAAFAEARRVLRAGGTVVFSVWDRIEDNEFAETVNDCLGHVFPDDPPTFMRRTPHGYFDCGQIARDLQQAGFRGTAQVTTEAARSFAPSPHEPAVAFCQGTPIRNEIEARDATRLDMATQVAAVALRRRFGHGPIEGKMQAHMISVVK
jgi:SAM-dependent methyltransferase